MLLGASYDIFAKHLILPRGLHKTLHNKHDWLTLREGPSIQTATNKTSTGQMLTISYLRIQGGVKKFNLELFVI